MTAMGQGFDSQTFSTICNPIYYKEPKVTATGGQCWTTLKPANVKPLLGLKLGLRGLLAYNATFARVSPLTPGATISWHNWASRFVDNMHAIEKEHDAVSADCLNSVLDVITDLKVLFRVRPLK